MAEIISFQIEEFWAGAKDLNGNLITVKSDNNDSGHALTYIPPQKILCGKKSNGDYAVIQTDNNGNLNY